MKKKKKSEPKAIFSDRENKRFRRFISNLSAEFGEDIANSSEPKQVGYGETSDRFYVSFGEFEKGYRESLNLGLISPEAYINAIKEQILLEPECIPDLIKYLQGVHRKISTNITRFEWKQLHVRA